MTKHKPNSIKYETDSSPHRLLRLKIELQFEGHSDSISQMLISKKWRRKVKNTGREGADGKMERTGEERRASLFAFPRIYRDKQFSEQSI